MSGGMVRKWVRAFKDGGTNERDDERSGRPLVATDSLVQKVDQTVKENIRYTIMSLSDNFHQVSRTDLYAIVTEQFNYRKL